MLESRQVAPPGTSPAPLLAEVPAGLGNAPAAGG